MDPGRSATAAGGTKSSVPFYAPLPNVKKTSAEIISEAREAITREPASRGRAPRTFAATRPVNTKRPFTPRERQRTLFGASRKNTFRPPSTFSLGYLSAQDDPATPPSPNVRRLHPLPHPAWGRLGVAGGGRWRTLAEDAEAEADEEADAKKRRTHEGMGGVRLRLPAIQRGAFRAAASLDNLPEELESEEEECQRVQVARKTRSSPVQRTRSMDAHLARWAEIDTCIADIDRDQFALIDYKINKTSDQLEIEGSEQKTVRFSSADQSRSTKETDTTKSFTKTAKSSTKSVPSSSEGDVVDIFDVDKWKQENSVVNLISVTSTKKTKQSAQTKRLLEDFQKIADYGVEVTENKLNESKLLEPRNQERNVKVNITGLESGEDLGLKRYEPEKKTELNVGRLRDVSAFDETETIVLKPDVSKRSPSKVDNVSDRFLGSKVVELCKEGDLIDFEVNIEKKVESVQTILAALNILAEKDGNDAHVLAVMIDLYTALAAEKAFSSSAKSSKVKSQTLKCVYKFVERERDELLLEIARIILAFRVRAANLTAVCKLVFKVSRNDRNDSFFMHGNLLELFVDALGSASPLEDAEACVYGYGTLKFLTMDAGLLDRVLKLGALELMVLHMKMVNTARCEGGVVSEQPSHALFQLTGALRNLASETDTLPRFVDSGAVVELCRALELFGNDLDLVSNVSRTLSIISTHDACCAAIIGYDRIFAVFVRLLDKYPGRQDIVVRLGYALGNLVARSDAARLKLFQQPGAVAALLRLLDIYLAKDALPPGTNGDREDVPDTDAGSNGSVEDVIVKVIRVVANMSIHPVVGSALACSARAAIFPDSEPGAMGRQISPDCQDDADKETYRFVDGLLTVIRRKSPSESEELVLGALASLNNLSFYPGACAKRQMEVAQALSPMLGCAGRDCVVEAARVLGNLTRSRHARDFLLESGGFATLVGLLWRDDPELLTTTTGVLVNMMSDVDKRSEFKRLNGPARLVTLLRAFGEGDWELAALVCQALWNYCIDSVGFHETLGEETTNSLLGVLIDLLDEERLFGIEEDAEVPESIVSSQDYQQWDVFAQVATNLMEKIDSYLDVF